MDNLPARNFFAFLKERATITGTCLTVDGPKDIGESCREGRYWIVKAGQTPIGTYFTYRSPREIFDIPQAYHGIIPGQKTSVYLFFDRKTLDAKVLTRRDNNTEIPFP